MKVINVYETDLGVKNSDKFGNTLSIRLKIGPIYYYVKVYWRWLVEKVECHIGL